MARTPRELIRRAGGCLAIGAATVVAAMTPALRLAAAVDRTVGDAAVVTTPAHRLEVPAAWPPDLPGCWPEGDSVVADKTAQRFWLCTDGIPVTAALAMTTASVRYGLPPVGNYPVTSKSRISSGIGGETLHDFTKFYVTPRGNNIGFHRVVNQDPSTLGDLELRGSSSGCFRVLDEHAAMIFEFLDVGDRVVVLTP